MSDFLSEELFAEELLAGRSRRKTKYKIKRRRRMKTRTKSLRKRNTNVSQKRQNRKNYKKRMKTDSNYRKNRKDYRKQYYKKNKKGSTGYSLPFGLEFLYQGIPAYLMSLSEMFDAVNIYVEGETAILVDLNHFLDNTEWYEEEDANLFIDLIEESYAVLEEDPDDAWSEYTLDERDPPAKSNIDKSASMRGLKPIFHEEGSLDDDELEEYGQNAFSKYYYFMPLSKDFFYHYTYADRVDEILEDGHLRPNHIMDSDSPGAQGVYAISGTWGWDVPSVQISGGKKKRIKEMVALKFKTDTKPKAGFVVEVRWDKPVKIKGAEVISISEARRQLKGRKEAFFREFGNHSEMIVFYDPKQAMKTRQDLSRMKRAKDIFDRRSSYRN